MGAFKHGTTAAASTGEKLKCLSKRVKSQFRFSKKSGGGGGGGFVFILSAN